jgi:EAL and modified HD-GYP domain-containing signal transduction protein
VKSFLQRVMPSVFGNKSPQAELQAPVAAPSRPTGTPMQAVTAAADVRQIVKTVGAKRPLISTQGDIAGFEFRVSDDVYRRLQKRDDPVAQSAHVAAALASARLTMQTGRMGLARLPITWANAWVHRNTSADSMGGAMVALQTADALHLSAELRVAYSKTANRLRELGAEVGWERTLDLDGEPDFVLARQGSTPMAELLGSIQRWSAEIQALPVVACDIASVEDLEAALQQGVQWACGALAPNGQVLEPAEALPVSPESRRIGQLLNLLVTGAETGSIVREIKGDVSLSYRLLKRLNSASFGQQNPVVSIDQAVMLLGRNELYRWLSLLLMQFAVSRKASSALQEVALWRSRLMELLAKERAEAHPEQLFTLGLASMLGVILKMSQTDVVDTLKLPEAARQALLEASGPWHVYLQMAMQIEAQEVDGENAVADQFGGAQRVLELGDEAWAWGAENTDRGAG